MQFYTRWINLRLAQCPDVDEVTNLFADMADGVRLCRLIEVITGAAIPAAIRIPPRNLHERRGNIEMALEHARFRGLRLESVHVASLVPDAEGQADNRMPMLALIFNLLLQFQIKPLLQQLADAAESSDMRGVMLEWLRQQLADAAISDVGRDFRDGRVLCRLVEALSRTPIARDEASLRRGPCRRRRRCER